MYDSEKTAQKQEKKISKVMFRSVGAMGIGVGLFLLRFLIAPFLGDNEFALRVLTEFSLLMIGFGSVMIITFIIKKDWLSQIYLAMIWIILPILMAKIFFDL